MTQPLGQTTNGKRTKLKYSSQCLHCFTRIKATILELKAYGSRNNNYPRLAQPTIHHFDRWQLVELSMRDAAIDRLSSIFTALKLYFPNRTSLSTQTVSTILL